MWHPFCNDTVGFRFYGGFVHQRYLISVITPLVILSLALIAGCGITAPPNARPAQMDVVSLDPQTWYISYSSGVPSHPSSDPLGAWSFQFPNGGHVNYIQTPFNDTTIPHV